MGLNQLVSRYWLAVGAIALADSLAAIAGGLVLHFSNSAQPPAPSLSWPLLVGVWGSGIGLVTGTAAIALAFVLKHQSQQEQRLRSIFEGAAIGIGLDSLDGSILESNPALQAMLGYSHDELTHMTFAEFTHPEDITTDVELFGELVSGSRDFYQVEKRHLRKDGEPVWVRMTNSMVRDHQGTPQYTVAVAENITQLKQAQASVQLYTDIVKRMQLGLLVWQLQDLNDLTSYRLIECNPAATQILQVKKPIEALIGQPMSAVFPELVDTAFPKLYADVIQSGMVRDLGEVRYGDNTIPEGIFATKAFPLPNQCVGLIFEDITDRKQAEHALQQSEARFRIVAETASCAFLVYQGNHLRYVNPAATEITGYSEEELTAMPFWELAHPDHQALIRERGLARQRGEAVPRRYDVKIMTKSGQIRWVDITAGSAFLDGQPAALATAYDITERKEAEAQLQLAANRERLLSEIALRIRRSLDLNDILNTTVAEVRQFLQADRVFIAQLHPSSHCQTVAESVDPAWAPVLGWEADGYAVEEICSLFKPDTVRVVNDTTQVEKTSFLKAYYDRCQVRAGMGVPIMLDDEMFGVLIVNQCGSPRQWQPFEVDLLEKLGTQVEIAIQQGQLYQQLRALAINLECQVEERTMELKQRMQELQHLNQVKDILLHAVTHDLRTPVHGMLMVLNHLRDKGNDTITVPRTVLDRMIDSSDRQLKLLNVLTEHHTGNQCQPTTCCHETIYLPYLLENALATLDPVLQKNEAIIINEVATGLPAIAADSAKLQQVLEHLIANAVQHNPPGRTITIQAKVQDTSPTNGKTTPTRPHIYCTITDNGRGMDLSQCDRLFNLHARGLTNRHLTGIGLGLHCCKQILALHGGKIGIKSQLNEGTTVWFTLPLADVDE